MKRHLVLACLLLGSALVVIPFAYILDTSASSAVGGFANHGYRTTSSPPTQHGLPSTFTVTTNADLGAGSLRDAINQANGSPGNDLINFNAGLGTINVGNMTGQPLPDITEAVTIDGGSPRNELNGTAAGASAAGLTIAAPGVTIRGMVINSFGGSGILILSDNCIIQDNFIGTNAAGTSALPNNQGGIVVDGQGNLIGGTTVNTRNLISGNGSFGIELSSALASLNTIQGNFIGTQASGTGALGNGGGVGSFGSANNNTIGGTVAGAANIIANNVGSGVALRGGFGNAVLGNSIFANGFGINLSDDPGITPNDVCDGDGGANGLQNFPVLTSANSGVSSTSITGTLDSTIASTYRIEFFSSPSCDSSGNGEGQTFIGSTTVNVPNAGCVAAINATIPIAVPVGQVITATATDTSNNTSEFSACVTVTGQSSDLQISKSDSPDPVVSGADITYAITIVNNGPDTDLGATFTDVIHPGSTFVSLSSPGSCITPSPGTSGTVTCSLGPLPSGVPVSITLVVNVNAPSGSTITNTATVSGMSSDGIPSNNSSTTTTAVITGSCTPTCPSDLFFSTSPTTSSCGRVVTYELTADNEGPAGCGAVTCVPPSGSVFAVGTTTVLCTAADGPSCSFNITIADETPPSITCSTGVTVPLPSGQSSAVVTYPAPPATDNCSATSVVCVPPSGSTFPVGSTLVTCTARDASENLNRCFFLVTVVDAGPPVIVCPANVSVVPPAGQTSAIVTYPAPTVSDNFPGASAVCTPPSGSSFSVGTTTVTCIATDARGNTASCSFLVGVGAAQVRVIIPGNSVALAFDANPKRKPPKPKNNPCAFFTIENIGFAPLALTFDSIKRTGADVTSGRISDTNDANGPGTSEKFFTLFRVNADQSLTQLNPGEALGTLQARQSQVFCAKFAALIPNLAGKNTGLAASDVLPNLVTSTISFRQNGGANVEVPILARVSTGVVLVNLSNRRAAPEILFNRGGDELTVSYGVFDSNMDVTRAKYEFLDASGQVVAGPFEIDLTASITSANLVRGQSFRVDQRFTGGGSNPEVTSVRVTVFDGETSAGATSSASAATVNSASVQLMNRSRNVTLYPPTVSLR